MRLYAPGNGGDFWRVRPKRTSKKFQRRKASFLWLEVEITNRCLRWIKERELDFDGNCAPLMVSRRSLHNCPMG
jgi:hypothetical protein